MKYHGSVWAWVWVWAALAIVPLLGCDVSGLVKQPPKQASPEETAAPAPRASTSQEPPRQDQKHAKKNKEPRAIPAQVGVGKKGRSLDDVHGIGNLIAQPAKTYFATKERIVFQIQIPHTMDLYRATTGSFPKSEEEFMREIIEGGGITLPDLPKGAKYKYDPEKAQLMVIPAK